jgi:hypothetical protein
MGMMNNGLSYWQTETEGIDLLDLTMGDLLDQRAEDNPSQEAIVYSCYPEFGDVLNICWTYQNYRDRANAVAKGLLALGLHIGRLKDMVIRGGENLFPVEIEEFLSRRSPGPRYSPGEHVENSYPNLFPRTAIREKASLLACAGESCLQKESVHDAFTRSTTCTQSNSSSCIPAAVSYL